MCTHLYNYDYNLLIRHSLDVPSENCLTQIVQTQRFKHDIANMYQ